MNDLDTVWAILDVCGIQQYRIVDQFNCEPITQAIWVDNGDGEWHRLMFDARGKLLARVYPAVVA